MQSIRRRLLSALFILTSMAPSVAQKKDWTFSDRTGIKGVQFSLGFSKVDNPEFWRREVFRQYAADSAWGDVNYQSASSPVPRQLPVTIEVVHAPFRFHTNNYLRRIELTGGIYHNLVDEGYEVYKYADVDEQTWEVTNVRYQVSNRQFGLQFGFNFSQPITSGLMVYAGYSIGANLFSRFSLTREEYSVKRFVDDPNSNNAPILLSETRDNPRTLAYSEKMLTQQLVVGLKAYLTCRINVYTEYNYRTFQIVDKGMRNNGHVFVLGVRFKFNPPEPKDPNEAPKERDAFW